MTAKADSRQSNPPTSSILVLRCDECEKRVKRDGYIKIDREAIARNAVMVGDWEVIDPDSDRVYWKILHPDCDPAPKPTDFRVSARMLPTESDLLMHGMAVAQSAGASRRKQLARPDRESPSG